MATGMSSFKFSPSKFIWTYWPLVIILIFACWQLRWLDTTPNSLPDAEETEFHLARAAAYETALENGHFPPRWASEFNYGLGYPIFNFHYPLPNWVMISLLPITTDLLLRYQLLLFIAVSMGGIGMYLYWQQQNQPRPTSLIVSLIYLSAPYWLYDVYVRSNPGELLAMALLPWVFWSIDKFAKNPQHSWPQLSIWASLLWLSHNITAVLAFPLVVCYILILHPQHRHKFILPLAISLILVAWFWVPAIVEQSATQINQDFADRNLANSTRSIKALLNLPPVIDYYINPQAQSITIQLGYATLLAASLSLAYWLARKQLVKAHYFWLGVFLLSAWLISNWSRLIWQYFDWLNFIQFPFRLSIFTSFSGAMLAGYLTKQQIRLSWLILGAGLVNLLFVHPPKTYLPINQTFLYDYPLTTTAARELDPPWYDDVRVQSFLENSSTVVSTLDSQPLHVSIESAYMLEFEIEATTSTHLVIQRLYFPGWKATTNGQPIDLDSTKYRAGGLINFDLPTGTHLVTVEFTQQTLGRVIGNSLSLVGLLLLLGSYLVSAPKRITFAKIFPGYGS